MKNSFNLKTLAIAVSLLSGSQAALALTPWTNGAPDVIIYTSGGAAQDLAFANTVARTLAVSSSIDVFQDTGSGSAGSRWTGFYFTGAANLPANLKGKKIYLEKRSLGAAGYGVVPLINNLPLDHLNIFSATVPTGGSFSPNQAGAWTLASSSSALSWDAGTSALVKKSYQAGISSTNAASFLVNTVSHGGFTGVDAGSLLQPGTINYPVAVTELLNTTPAGAGKATANWPDGTNGTQLNWDTIKSTISNKVTVIPTGGLAYAVNVTDDLYRVLQAAQKLDGTLPSTVTVGDYGKNGKEIDLPTLSRNTVAALLSGGIESWDQLQVVSSGTAYRLNDPTILAAAGINATHSAGVVKTAPTDYRVAFGIRNPGAAIGALHYAKFLNYPANSSAFAPANAEITNIAANELAAIPLFKAPGGASATGSLLVDWQKGTNTSGLNNAADGASKPRYWGIALNSADRSDSSGNWKVIRIDGYAPTLENVASGNYPIWGEGQLLINKTNAPANTPAANLLTALANDLGSSTNANLVDHDSSTAQPWGITGIFGTTAQAQNAAAVVNVPFDSTAPVIGLTHLKGLYTSIFSVPAPYDNGNQTYTDSIGNTVLTFQLK